MVEHRAVFDFRITFVNGGEVTGRDFRLDVPSGDVDRSTVGVLLVRHLGLLMVDRVDLDPFRIVEEPHRGGRGLEVAPVGHLRIVELSHPIRHGMVTYPGSTSCRHRDSASTPPLPPSKTSAPSPSAPTPSSPPPDAGQGVEEISA